MRPFLSNTQSMPVGFGCPFFREFASLFLVIIAILFLGLVSYEIVNYIRDVNSSKSYLVNCFGRYLIK